MLARIDNPVKGEGAEGSLDPRQMENGGSDQWMAPSLQMW